MSKSAITILTCWLALLASSCTMNEFPRITERNHAVVIKNKWVSFEFDQQTGYYQIANNGSSQTVISQASLGINDWRSDADGLSRTWSKRPITNEFGEGLALDLVISGPGQPDLLFTVMLYQDQTFIDLSGGIYNSLDASVQIKDLSVLADGQLYQGRNLTQDFALVDGFSGGEPLEYGRRLYSPLSRRNALKSRNNILLSFTENDNRNNLIMGGLSYYDFDKYAYIEQARRLELQKGKDEQKSLLCYLNLPVDTIDQSNRGEVLTLVKGKNLKKWQYHEFHCSESATTAMDTDEIIIELDHLHADAKYSLGFSWWRSLWHGDRKEHFQSVFIEYQGDQGMTRLPLFEDQIMPLFDGRKKEGIQQVEIRLPEEAVAAGQARIVIGHADWEKIVREDLAPRQSGRADPNVYLSEIWLRDASFESLLPDTLVDIDESPRHRIAYTAQLFASDPVGKKVDPGQTYQSSDRFFISTLTTDPFLGLEEYGQAVKIAQGIDLSMYDFPTVCLWYAEHPGYGGGQAENSTLGAVNEMKTIQNSGFLNYSRAAVRLVPDSYMPNNQQGWWDDEHWQKEVEKHNGSMNGRYVEPYETSEKWGNAVTELGGIPLTYFQAGFRSEDYAKAFPNHMLFNKSHAWKGQEYDLKSELFTTWNQTWARNGRVWAYDYTDPDFITHLKEVYTNMKKGGIKGLMFDYPASGRAKAGGMEDQYATTAAAYRNIFMLPNQGFGPGAYVHERNMEIGSDVSIGTIASMRTENDTDKMDGATVTRCGLRWYKNRVLYNQDTDSKNIARLQGSRDAVRAVLTMAYVTTGRLLLANSFTQFTAETFYDITRTFPYHTATKSARPIDAFVSDMPMVYDFEVNQKWHQVTYYNPDFENPKEVKIQISGDPVNGALDLDPQKNYLVYDFWNDTFCGVFAGQSEIKQQLRPGEARMLSVREQLNHPQVISTNRHIMQGYLDLDEVEWNPKKKELTGLSQVITNDPYEITIANNGFKVEVSDAENSGVVVRAINMKNEVTKLILEADGNQSVKWSIKFGQ